ncbi:MAG: hypothetical protein ACKVT1_19350 [Dehalococcoidia bacterium]
MRGFGVFVGGAVVLFLTWLAVAAIASYFDGHFVPDGAVPNSWAPPSTWATWRDIVIVLFAFFWFFAGVLLCALLAVLVFLALQVRTLLKQNVGPAVDSLKESLDNVRGTTEFAGETIVSPLIRMYSVVKGVRTGVGALRFLPDRVRGRKKKKRGWPK